MTDRQLAAVPPRRNVHALDDVVLKSYTEYPMAFVLFTARKNAT